MKRASIVILFAARETAEALVYGRLQSGGWTQVIHFARPARGRLGRYRKGRGGSWNVSSLDDGQTQAALQCLIQVLEGKARRIIRDLDQQGRWITTYAGERLVGQPKFQRGFRYISSDVFSRNVESRRDAGT
jgi:hypothetical protein